MVARCSHRVLWLWRAGDGRKEWHNRHTFLRKLAETKGVHYAKAASGHQSYRYIWRYVKLDRETLAEAIDP
jgi:hypothetical protein